MSDAVNWGTVVLAIVVALIGGGAAGSAVAALADRRSEYYTDVRHLRDLRTERLRATFGRLLQVAGTQADLVRDRAAILQVEPTDERRELLNEAINRAAEGYTEARIALRLEPKFYTKIDPLFHTTQKAYEGFSIAARLPGLPFEKLTEYAALLDDAVSALHDEMLRALDRLDEPIPPKPWWTRDYLGTLAVPLRDPVDRKVSGEQALSAFERGVTIRHGADSAFPLLTRCSARSNRSSRQPARYRLQPKPGPRFARQCTIHSTQMGSGHKGRDSRAANYACEAPAV